jgi:hypothetical protein
MRERADLPRSPSRIFRIGILADSAGGGPEGGDFPAWPPGWIIDTHRRLGVTVAFPADVIGCKGPQRPQRPLLVNGRLPHTHKRVRDGSFDLASGLVRAHPAHARANTLMRGTCISAPRRCLRAKGRVSRLALLPPQPPTLWPCFRYYPFKSDPPEWKFRCYPPSTLPPELLCERGSHPLLLSPFLSAPSDPPYDDCLPYFLITRNEITLPGAFSISLLGSSQPRSAIRSIHLQASRAF